MQVKVFESDDIASGLKMVKAELGPDALILSTKTIRSGKLGLLGKSHFEITAAIDNTWPHKGGSSTNNNSPSNNDLESERDMLLSPQNNTSYEEPHTYNATSRLNSVKTDDVQVAPPKPKTAVQEPPSQLQEEVNELKGMIKTLGQEMLRINNPAPVVKSSVAPSQDAPLFSLHQRLLDYGIGEETAQTISDFAKESLTLDESTDPFKQQHFIEETINDLLNVGKGLFNEEKRQHRIALVGPTGVGKTTTLAKIAANYLSKESLKIAFITIDTYRIAAIEQLKVYGDIMNIPVEVVLNPEQLENALLKFRDKDLVLIDTAGRSPQDNFCIEELSSFFQPELFIEKHLVLSATTRENELFNAIHRFSVLGLDNTIITKIDECTSLGILLDIQIREKIPYSFITNGQKVPEDIMEADKNILTQLIMSPGKGLPHE
ncbi:MAG: flagellar biosynthesis protein FlhF [Desulfocapsa sp.]|nr:flagellar biosynthesis protein FlhF [Desulfocapsa sp.]